MTSDPLTPQFDTDRLKRLSREELIQAVRDLLKQLTLTLQEDTSQSVQADFLHQITDKAPIAILVCNLQTNTVEFANRYALDMVGIPYDENVSFAIQHLRARFHPKDRPQWNSILSAIPASDGSELETAEFRVNHAQIGFRHMGFNVIAFEHTPDGTVLRSVIVANDVTELYAGQASILQAELERERIKLIAKFIGDAGHEFRTPISSINTATYMLRRYNEKLEDEEIRALFDHSINRIESSSEEITHLLDSLLMITRLDTQSGTPRIPVNLQLLLDNALGTIKSSAERHNIRTRADITAGVLEIHASPDSLHIALKELLKNALAATADGGLISLSAHTAPDGGIYFVVQDNGIGMDEETLMRGFERFYRQDKARSTRGFGLGLPIVKRIVERHDGDIKVKSAPGIGTTVTIHLPKRERGSLCG